MRATNDVMLRIGDFSAAKSYYSGALGFPIVAEAENLLGFDLGGFVLYFERGDDNGSVFEFQVPDVARAKERPRCYMRDPFGLIFNLTQTFE